MPKVGGFFNVILVTVFMNSCTKPHLTPWVKGRIRGGVALGREGFLRVTVGTPEENERFLAALGELL